MWMLILSCFACPASTWTGCRCLHALNKVDRAGSVEALLAELLSACMQAWQGAHCGGADAADEPPGCKVCSRSVLLLCLTGL